jgi:hypothetical protein
MTKRNIGDFGAAVDEATANPEDVMTFTLGPDKAEFYVDTDTGFIPFGQFAQAATSGLDTADMEGTAAVMNMMHDCIAANPGTGKTKIERARTARDKEQEWARFKQVATKYKVKMDVMLEIVSAVFEARSGKADQPPSDSSNGQSATATGRSSRRKPASDRAHFEPVTAEVLKGLGG